MHLTPRYPQVLEKLKHCAAGLWPTRIGDKTILIVKAPKEIILTARENKGFDFYLAPVSIAGVSSYLLLTVFYDDADEPLALKTPFFEKDPSIPLFIELFKSNEFEVYFFDEHDREWLSYRVSGPLNGLVDKLKSSSFISIEFWREMTTQAEYWFGTRGTDTDSNAYSVEMVEGIFTEQLTVIDASGADYGVNGAEQVSATSLDREEPGVFQEWDIALLLRRVFPGTKIYLSPYKDSDQRELVDVLVMGEHTVYLIQAKDSPNTLRLLRTRVKRKRGRSITQAQEASKQLAGAINFCEKNQVLNLNYKGKKTQLDITGKKLLGIVVIKEIFNDAMLDYSKIIFDLMNDSHRNVVIFDYPELGQMTFHCPSEELFLGAIGQILDAAHELGQIPRLRYGGITGAT